MRTNAHIDRHNHGGGAIGTCRASTIAETGAGIAPSD